MWFFLWNTSSTFGTSLCNNLFQSSWGSSKCFLANMRRAFMYFFVRKCFCLAVLLWIYFWPVSSDVSHAEQSLDGVLCDFLDWQLFQNVLHLDDIALIVVCCSDHLWWGFWFHPVTKIFWIFLSDSFTYSIILVWFYSVLVVSDLHAKLSNQYMPLLAFVQQIILLEWDAWFICLCSWKHLIQTKSSNYFSESAHSFIGSILYFSPEI